MLKSRELVVYSLLAAMGLSFPVRESQARLFDFSSPKRPATVARRGQSPDPAFSGSGPPIWQPEGEYAPLFHNEDDCHLPTGWGYDSSPCYWPKSQGVFGCRTWCGGPVPGSFNCGSNDHYIDCTKFHLRKCGQTWYPRMAPYCQPGWGWTQPCWRRPPDNYNCQRPEAPQKKSPQRASEPPVAPTRAPPSTAPPATVPPPAAPVTEPPPPPPAAASSVSQMPQTRIVNRSAGPPQIGRPVAARPAPVIQPSRPRISASGYTTQPQRPTDDEEELDTLERRMENARIENSAVEADEEEFAE